MPLVELTDAEYNKIMSERKQYTCKYCNKNLLNSYHLNQHYLGCDKFKQHHSILLAIVEKIERLLKFKNKKLHVEEIGKKVRLRLRTNPDIYIGYDGVRIKWWALDKAINLNIEDPSFFNDPVNILKHFATCFGELLIYAMEHSDDYREYEKIGSFRIGYDIVVVVKDGDNEIYREVVRSFK